MKTGLALLMSQAACRCLPAIHGDGQLGHAAIEKIQGVSRVL
jgi:hypothetical protein